MGQTEHGTNKLINVMNLKKILLTDVSVFKTINKVTPNCRMEVFPLYTVLKLGDTLYKNEIEECRKYSKKETPDIEKMYKDLKSSLPVFTTSCLCHKGVKDVVRINNILCLDIDEQDNKGMDPEKVKRDLLEIPSVFYTSLSVGGHGVFGLMYIDMDLDINTFKNDFKEMYKCVQDYIYTTTGYVIDKQCNNVNRVRIVSTDDNPLYKNPDDSIEMFTWVKSNIENECITKPTPKFRDINDFTLPERKRNQEFIDLLDDDDFCVSCVNYCIDRLGLQTIDYQDWISHLGSLTSLGSKGEVLGIKLSQLSPKYTSDDDVIRTMKSLSKREGQRQFLTRYFKMCKDSLGPSWIQEIKKHKQI